MARRLLEAGHRVTVHNRALERELPLTGLGVNGSFIVDNSGGFVLDVFGGLHGWVLREVGLGESGLLAVA